MSLLDAAKQQGDPEAAEDPAEEQSESPDQESAEMSEQDLDAMQQQIAQKVPPDQQDAFQRVVTAGMKVLYSKDTSNMLMEEIQSNEPIDKKLAGGTAGLMALLNQQAKGAIPPEVYMPAAATLLLDVAEVIVKGGGDVTQQNVRDGLDQMQAAIMAKHGASPDAITSTLSGKQPPQAPQQPAPPQPPVAPAQPGAMP